MSLLLRRRIAADLPIPTTTTTSCSHNNLPNLAARDTMGTPTATAVKGFNTISPYQHGLNGVNQTQNMLFKDILWWSLGILALVMLSIRLLEIAWSKLRHVSSMSVSADKQGYWKYSQWNWMPSVKKHVLYAPLWKKRHNREIRLSSAFSVGTLPSRFHTILLAVYLISNFIYMFVLEWTRENKWSVMAELRGRAGSLATINMVPLIILAGRNNPLISLLRVSFDTYNLLHRWMGRMVVFDAVVHTIAWAIVQIADGGLESVKFRLLNDNFIAVGFMGMIALCFLLVLSVGPVRHAFYETFLNVHIILALIVFITTWIHCAVAQVGTLPQLPWVVAVFLIWLFDRLARMIRIVYNNYAKRNFTEASLTPLRGDATRVTLFLPKYVDIQPGTHAYLRFAEAHPWESHPFSIAWVEHFPNLDKKRKESKDNITEADYKRGTTSVSFVIGAHTGFTRSLYNKALAGENDEIYMRAAMEGPYAGHHSLDSYGHAVLFAGSTGITHQLSYLKPLIEGYAKGTIATRRVTLVWIMRDYEALEWVRPWMDKVLRMERRKEVLNVRLFITRPKNPNEMKSNSNTVAMFPGRPNILSILKSEVEDQVGAMCVTVCGPGALADDVRQAVRKVQSEASVVDFVEESFTW